MASCPNCSTEAYVGLNVIECSNSECKFYCRGSIKIEQPDQTKKCPHCSRSLRFLGATHYLCNQCEMILQWMGSET